MRTKYYLLKEYFLPEIAKNIIQFIPLEIFEKSVHKLYNSVLFLRNDVTILLFSYVSRFCSTIRDSNDRNILDKRSCKLPFLMTCTVSESIFLIVFRNLYNTVFNLNFD